MADHPFPNLEGARLASANMAGVSPDAGNILKQHDNGLYVALAAPANVSSLFLDAVNGDDNNPGTMQAPIKTLARASYLVNTLGSGVGTYTISLKSGQTYTTAGVNSRFWFNGTQINFRVWGEPKYVDSTGFVNYFPTSAVDFQRATINLGSYDVGDGTIQAAGISSFGNLYFEGIVLNGPTNHQFGGSEMVACSGAGTIGLFGCDINIGRHIFVTNAVSLDACVINFQNVGAQSWFTTYGCRGPIVINTDSGYAGDAAAKQYPWETKPRPAYTGRIMHMRDRITRANFSTGQDWTHDPVTYGASINYYIAP